jgi:hypothetical protein
MNEIDYFKIVVLGSVDVVTTLFYGAFFLFIKLIVVAGSHLLHRIISGC